VRRFETEYGPVLHHYLGPLRSKGSSADFRRGCLILQDLWGDLRGLIARTI
jgi:hypothetical protein